MTTFFISGHLDLSADEFMAHYAPKIDETLSGMSRFVVGDASRGADRLAQEWLYARGYLGVLTVYHMLSLPRFVVHDEVERRGGFTSDEERDAAMTRDSGADIAWVRPGREQSGTAKNLARRAQR